MRQDFKLGDKVVVEAGAHLGREGHIIRITANGREQAKKLLVRFSADKRESVFTPRDVRKA